MKDKGVRINLNGVQRTLLLPLLARAKEAGKKSPIVHDTYARDIVERIEYDLSKIEAIMNENEQLVWIIRAYNFDNTIRDLLVPNYNAAVINIGAGLDTTFQRVDNGSVFWVNIDLPDAADLRRTLIPDSEREKTIAKSVLDFTWIDDIAQETRGRPIIFMAAGVLWYFETSEVKTLLLKLADAYPHAHFVFDSMPWLWVWISNQTIMKKTGLSPSAHLKWHLEKASDLKKWVDTIKIVEEYPMFSRVQFRSDWSHKMIRDIKIANLLRVYSMVHVQL